MSLILAAAGNTQGDLQTQIEGTLANIQGSLDDPKKMAGFLTQLTKLSNNNANLGKAIATAGRAQNVAQSQQG